jgi:hypothetical protein
LVHQKIDSRRRDYGADKNWRSNLKLGGGFGWGVKFSSFGASKKRLLSPSKQGGVSRGGRKRWCRMKNPPEGRFCGCALTRSMAEDVILAVG